MFGSLFAIAFFDRSDFTYIPGTKSSNDDDLILFIFSRALRSSLPGCRKAFDATVALHQQEPQDEL